ncbi:MAG: capsule assembly Wzi family protein, partial [Saprospiraceae bacterium]
MTSRITPLALFLALLAIIFPHRTAAQGMPLPLEDDATYELIDSWVIRFGSPDDLHLNARPLTRGQVVRYARYLDTTYATQLSSLDRYGLERIFYSNSEWLGASETNLPLARRDNTDGSLIGRALDNPDFPTSERPILGIFYRSRANLLEVNQPNVFLRLDPLLDLRYGRISGSDQPYFFNQRGLRLRGGVDDRIYFSFDLQETQAAPPPQVADFVERFQAYPGQGFLKDYTLDALNITRGFDFLNSQAYLGFNVTDHVGVQFGYGRNFIGDGARSLLLSDFANNYLHLRLNWRVWKFHYQNIFAELTGEVGRRGANGLLPKRYLAAHHLSIKLGQKMRVGVYEAVVFGRDNGFELGYLNPVIFYRTVEQSLGSPDNALIGADARIDVAKHFRFYGQVILDEFLFDELFVQRRGWWANKWGLQAGVQYAAAFGIEQLDLRAEYNRVRPFTYSHKDSIAAYAHYNQPLAHPLGANFSEVLLRANYRPLPHLSLGATAIFVTQGENPAGQNIGTNPLLSNRSRLMDFGNEIGQGDEYSNRMIQLEAAYEIFPNFWLDASYTDRNKVSGNPVRSSAARYWT